MPNYDEIKSWVRALSECSYRLARSGALPIFMGGDHSLSMGSVNGVARTAGNQPAAVRTVAHAHADYNTPSTTLTATCTACLRRSYAASRPRSPARRPAARLITPDQLDCSASARSIRWKEAGARARFPIADMRAIDEFGVGVLIRRVIDASSERRAACVLRCRLPRSRRRPASAPRCPAAPPIARRIW